jgi:hypothetical protein
MEGDIGGKTASRDQASPGFGTAEVITKVCDAAFGKPLVTNVLRGQVVEAMIALALEPHWTWCSADYASWDFERPDGVRLEVKQSAYRQSWETSFSAKVRPSFDVAKRKTQWDGETYIETNRRAAHIYVLAYHDRRDDAADHRDPRQWEFFVLPSSIIPPVARIALGSVRRLTDSVLINELADRVEHVAATSR